MNEKINVMHYNLKDNKNQNIWDIVRGQPGGRRGGNMDVFGKIKYIFSEVNFF